MEPVISVIIPVYNVADYLTSALNSLSNQSFTNFEAILINDGSTDGSADICNSFQNSDKRFIVINQANQGVATTRNTGIKISKGKYIAFFDSDDLLEKDYLLNLYEDSQKIQSYNSLIMHSYNRVKYPNTLQSKTSFENKIFKTKEEIALFLETNLGLYNTVWNNLYCAETIKKHNIYFNEKLTKEEDTPFVIKYFAFTDVLLTSSTSNYNYIDYSNIKVTLSKTKYFDKEFLYLDTLYKCIQELIHNSNNKEELYLGLLNFASSSYLGKYVNPIYRDSNTSYSRNERLAFLRKLGKERLEFINKYYHPTSLRKKILKHIIVKAKFALFDTLNLHHIATKSLLRLINKFKK